MAYREAWTPKAHRDYEAIIEYLVREWSPKEAKNFVDDLEKQISHVKRHPYMFQESAIKVGVRRIVIENKFLYITGFNPIQLRYLQSLIQGNLHKIYHLTKTTKIYLPGRKFSQSTQTTY